MGVFTISVRNIPGSLKSILPAAKQEEQVIIAEVTTKEAEIIKEVPVEITKIVEIPVIQEKIVEVIKEVPVIQERIVEVIKEVKVEVIREIEKPIEIIKEIEVPVIKEVEKLIEVLKTDKKVIAAVSIVSLIIGIILGKAL